jgi:hypothetical protein
MRKIDRVAHRATALAHSSHPACCANNFARSGLKHLGWRRALGITTQEHCPAEVGHGCFRGKLPSSRTCFSCRIARQRVRCAPSVGDRAARADADAGQLVDQGGEHRRLAALKMIGARGVDDDPIGLIRRDDRGKALEHPKCEPVERLAIASRIGLLDQESGNQHDSLTHAGNPSLRSAGAGDTIGPLLRPIAKGGRIGTGRRRYHRGQGGQGERPARRA